jgi:hypothetical protein
MHKFLKNSSLFTNGMLSAAVKSRSAASNSSTSLQLKRSFWKTAQLLQEGPTDYGYANPDERFIDQHPTINYAKTMPNRFSTMRHEQILQLCVEGSYSARKEALIRNVMAVDTIEYDEAEKVVADITKHNKNGMVYKYLPYHIGMGGSLFAGAVSFPMIFDLQTVQMFNERFVTSELPDMKDLETFLEVGSCSWSWMEPIIGQVSFVLLILQFARNQALNLGLKPYGDWVKNRSANSLMSAYPQYDEVFVRWYSESQTLYGSRFLD